MKELRYRKMTRDDFFTLHVHDFVAQEQKAFWGSHRAVYNHTISDKCYYRK